MPYGRGTLGALGGMDRPLMVPMGMGMDLPDMASPETPGQRQRGEGYLNWMAEAQRRRALGPQRPMRHRPMAPLMPTTQFPAPANQAPMGDPRMGQIPQDFPPYGTTPQWGMGGGWMGGLTPWLSGGFRRG